MENTEEIKVIGKEIVSIAFGIGTILGIEKLEEGGDDYYVVEFGNKNLKNFFPINENRKIRFVSTESEFLKNIKELKSKKIKKEFQTKKERQAYFSSVLGDCNLNQVIERILEIKSIEDLITFEKEKLKKLIAILEMEASTIYKKTETESQEFISGFVKVA